jgi:hypothetical protein
MNKHLLFQLANVRTGQRLREAKNNAKPREEQAETPSASAPSHAENTSQAHGSCPFGSHAVCKGFLDVEMVPLLADDVNAPPALVSPSSSSSTHTDLMPFNIGNISQCMSTPTPTQTQLIAPILGPSDQPHHPITFAGALYINGQILNIPCSTVVPAKSQPVGPEIPLPLHPTELQLMTIHPPWIDRFPFPKMRNSLISLSGVIDEEEFVRDMLLMPSFEIVHGRMPWDPRAWKILRPFAEKWGYLFFGDV